MNKDRNNYTFQKTRATTAQLLERKETQGFFDWTKRSMTAHMGKQIDGDTYHVPYQYQQIALAGYASYSFEEKKRHTEPAKASVFNSDDQSELNRMGSGVEPTALPYHRTISYSPGGNNNNVVYVLTYRENELPAVTKKAPTHRSRHQNILRIKWNQNPKHLEYTAVYLGKYYVGDVMPYANEPFWTGDNLLNNVQRIQPIVGSTNKTIYWNVGERTVGTMQEVLTPTKQVQYGLFYGYPQPIAETYKPNGTLGSITKERLLWPYSETYQGDTKD